ncbi:unnamed protein product, partial [Phaeothamnion confervicola]
MAGLSGLQAVLDGLEARLQAVETAVGKPGGAVKAATGASSAQVAPYIAAFDEYCASSLDPFLAACGTLGGGGAALGDIVKRAWAAQREFLVMASQCKKPDQATITNKLAPLMAAMNDAAAAVKQDDWENHAKAVKEGLACMSWVAVSPPALPKNIVECAVEGIEYWANKIRVQYKKTAPEQIAFCDTLKGLLTGLQAYVVAHHVTGVEWKKVGGADAASFSGGAIPAAAAAVTPIVASAAPAKPASAPAVGLGNILGELGKGLAITGGLKAVSRDQQTWRPEYKAPEGTPAPVAKPAAAAAAPKPAAKGAATKGTPRVEFLQAGLKWVVENQGPAEGLVTVEVTDKKHQVYIYGCADATIDIKGKCKSVAVDSCKKTRILMDSALASVETVNCQRLQLQVRGSVPSVAIDKTDGFLIYLSNEGLATTFTTSKSSEMNVSFPRPGAGDDADLIEMPIPEQFVHTIKLEPAPTITS